MSKKCSIAGTIYLIMDALAEPNVNIFGHQQPIIMLFHYLELTLLKPLHQENSENRKMKNL